MIQSTDPPAAAIAAATPVAFADPALVLRVDGDPATDVPVGDAPIAIGSGPRCEIRIDGAGSKPVCCVVSRRGDAVVARRWADGVRLNGDAFTESPLEAGDELDFGSRRVVVLPVGSDEPAERDAVDEPETAEPEAAPTEALWAIETALPTPSDEAEPEVAPTPPEAIALLAAPAPPAAEPPVNEQNAAINESLGARLRNSRSRVGNLVRALRESRADAAVQAAAASELRDELASSERRADELSQQLAESAAQLQEAIAAQQATADRLAAEAEAPLAPPTIDEPATAIEPEPEQAPEPEPEPIDVESDVSLAPTDEKAPDVAADAPSTETDPWDIELPTTDDERSNVDADLPSLETVEVGDADRAAPDPAPQGVDEAGEQLDPFAAPEQPSDAEQPKSFYEQFAHLLPDDDEEPAASIEAPAAAAAPEPVSSDPDDEDSIEDYLQKMMARIRGDVTTPEAAAEPAAEPEPEPIAEVVEVVQPPAPRIADLAELGQRDAPEQTADIGALRQIANQSARDAISTADRSQTTAVAPRQVSIAVATTIAGMLACALSPHLFGWQMGLGVAAVAIGGSIVWSTLRDLRDTDTAGFVDDADPRTGQQQPSEPTAADPVRSPR